MLRVLHLVGSPTDEFHADLSLLYARDCLAATDDPGHHESLIAFVSPDGSWRFPAGLSRKEITAAEPLGLADALPHLDADVALPQMFCGAGMTTYRALLDLLEIPYVGNTPAAMSLTADKAKTRAIVAAAGVAVPSAEVVRRGELPTLALPVVVKPVTADNSHGVSLVGEPAELEAALADALVHGDRALVESYVELGREVRCGVVEEHGEARCLALEEYAVDSVRTAADKLLRGEEGELRLVAKDPRKAWIVDGDDPIVAGVKRAALTCHDALGCRDHSLFDFRIDPSGRPWFLEAGLYCSFARDSVICAMAHAAGTQPADLLRTGIAGALNRTRKETA